MGPRGTFHGVLGMKFCPKCGGVMMLTKRDEIKIFKCSRCGYELEVGKGEEQMYRSIVRGERRVLTTKVVTRKKAIDTSRQEELEQAKDSYYEIVLDHMGEYGD